MMSEGKTIPFQSGVYQSGSHTAPSVAKLPVNGRKPPDTSLLRESPAVKGT